MNTITALATPLGNAAISVIRLSGEDCLDIVKKFFTAKSLDYANITPRYMYLGNFVSENVCDKCYMIYFVAPDSYTGEDMVELQCHGGARLTEEILSTLIANGSSLANKGEFTKRAFLNGKVSLSEAEGIIDMINGESKSAINAGYRLMKGEVNRKIADINDIILDLCSSLEASLDYPEELEDEAKESAGQALSLLHIELKDLLATSKIGRVLKHGINVAIIGSPNVGKSSLLNAITQTNKAIVTEIAGTTRDIVEERIEVDGITINFLDTAGIRSTTNMVEKIGIERAIECADNSDFVIILLDGTKIPTFDEENYIKKYSNKPHIITFNKHDQGILPSNTNYNHLEISAMTGYNIEILLKRIVRAFVKNNMDSGATVLTNLRHSEAIANALDYIKSANYSSASAPTECLLVDLKAAYYALGEITGDTANESIIDRVFEKFCLGK